MIIIQVLSMCILYTLIIYTIFHNILITTICILITKTNCQEKLTLSSFLVLCIIIPFIEESIFRSCLVTLLDQIQYYKIIISSIFGLMHTYNVFTTNITTSNSTRIIIGISQSIMTFFLGQFLIELSLGYAIISHMIYNCIVVGAYNIQYMIINKLYPSKKTSLNLFSNYRYVSKPKFKKSVSTNCIKSTLEIKRIEITKFPDDIKNILQINLYRDE